MVTPWHCSRDLHCMGVPQGDHHALMKVHGEWELVWSNQKSQQHLMSGSEDVPCWSSLIAKTQRENCCVGDTTAGLCLWVAPMGCRQLCSAGEGKIPSSPSCLILCYDQGRMGLVSSVQELTFFSPLPLTCVHSGVLRLAKEWLKFRQFSLFNAKALWVV